MIKVGIVGAGKMGLSHLSILNMLPDVQIVGVCDSIGYVLDVLNKYTGVPTFADYKEMIRGSRPDAIVVATPSKTHAEIVRFALAAGIHVFVEKPFCLSIADGQELVQLAESRGLVNQVGYHYRFVAAFRECKRLLDSGSIGRVHNFRIEAYGPVVLQAKGSTWRSSRIEGGGCLYDYASHAANLITYCFGMPERVSGAVVNRVFSRDVDDEVYATVYFASGLTGQICINWSDETHRKMSMRLEAWGTEGKLNADRQECQLYLRNVPSRSPALREGWSVNYTTELTQPVQYYVRGEEYSAQLEYFIDCIRTSRVEKINSFASAFETDKLLDAIQRDAQLGVRTTTSVDEASMPVRSRGIREKLIRWLGGQPDYRRGV